MRNVALLVKNGIGFGHLRRALLIAEAIRREGRLRPVIISQASSLSLFRDTSVEVVNFPLLHRVSSAVAEDTYTAILDRLLDRLDPAVVIEDTYPDPRYLSLRALANRPRVLVMRRLDGTSFDQLREQGRFAAYDKVLVAQSRDEFAHEGHSGESVAAVEFSERFSFIGNLSYAPTEVEISQVRAAFAPDGAPLVVVNGGAGGDQMADGYGDRLYDACARVAERLHVDGHRARFVFVTGPYYAGRPLQETHNVVVRRFEPRLGALLAAAHVAVIKPGNNVLSETLIGRAHLILVPDVSFMEGLNGHAARVTDVYGGATASPDPIRLETLIRDALVREPRSMCAEPNDRGLSEVVDAVNRCAQPVLPRVARRRLLLVLVPGADCDPDVLRRRLPEPLQGSVVLGAAGAPIESDPSAHAWLLGSSEPEITPQDAAEKGVRLLITSKPAAPAAARWQRLAPSIPALAVIEASTITAVRGQAALLMRTLTHVLEAEESPCVILDLSKTGGEEAHQQYLDETAEWLVQQPVEIVGPDTATALRARRLLEQA